MYFVFTPYITNIMVQHEGCILPISTILNYLPIIAPDYHPFVNIKGMYYLLIWIFLPNTYHFEIVLLPDTMKSSSILRNVDKEVTINGTITTI